jgi:hypothetical protein
MLLSIDKARKSLPNFWLGMGGFNTMALVLFLVPLFKNEIPTYHILGAMGITACSGCIIGLYYTFRAQCGSAAAFFILFHLLLTLEFMFAGGTAAFAALIAGRPDLRWLAFFTNTFCMTLTLLYGMYNEAKVIGWWRTSAADRWQKKIEKYIDYSTQQISPSLTTPNIEKGRATKSPIWIVAVGSANIPLIFEMYAGGRANAIFLVVPVMTGVLGYLNLTSLGPSLVRLLLLRKLEKATGYRFINADLEQIQELRRGFFMARWLMKDFVPIKK